ncbi:hypothetical protein E2I00_018839 [Balaenoptera physalus]|uniref:Uncharacterized protein n=1 Tax=Balaenoptera physalus TaxID=9770 RepID=A0A643C6Z1_BALPH|nr:hypothetical protein E2I00_018839 [Balaenoptera physalus]
MHGHVEVVKLLVGAYDADVDDGGDHHHHHHHHHHHLAEGLAAGKAKEPGRKASGSSSGRMKPRLNKIRFRTQIIHTTPSFRDPEQPLEEGEDEEEDRSFKGHSSSFKLRPKSNVFGYVRDYGSGICTFEKHFYPYMWVSFVSGSDFPIQLIKCLLFHIYRGMNDKCAHRHNAWHVEGTQ